MDGKIQENVMWENARREELLHRERELAVQRNALGGGGTVKKCRVPENTVDKDGELPMMFKLDPDEKKVPGSLPTTTTTKKDDYIDKARCGILDPGELSVDFFPRTYAVSARYPTTRGPFEPQKGSLNRAKAKLPTKGGNSSSTATSRIDDEPFELASRWTKEERDRKKEFRKGLAEDGEEEWVVV